MFGQTASQTEDRFEGLALKAFGQKRNARNNNGYKTLEGKYPDAVCNAILVSLLKLSISSEEHDNWEVKLLGSNSPSVTDDAQMRSIILDVSRSKAGKQGVGSVWIITAANNSVSANVRMGATNASVNIFHSAVYQDPTNPRILYFSQWRGVSITGGTALYNSMYGNGGPLSFGPFTTSVSF